MLLNPVASAGEPRPVLILSESGENKRLQSRYAMQPDIPYYLPSRGEFLSDL